MTTPVQDGRRIVRLGPWRAALDPRDAGVRDGWTSAAPDHARPVPVPGYLQESFPGAHGLVWYWTEIGQTPAPTSGRIVVRFAAIWYRAEFWLDGEYLGRHEGSGQVDLEITDRWQAGRGRGLLAVRLLNPTTARIDGLVLAETPGANAFDEDGYWPGRLYNYGGITGAVELVDRANLGLDDIHVIADQVGGSVDVEVAVRNDTGSAVDVRWQCAVGSRDDAIDIRAGATRIMAGGGRISCRLEVADPRTWSPDRPFLYDVDVTVVPAGGTDGPTAMLTRRVRTGFRTLSVDSNGFFVLNGKRVFVRSTHTGNHVPAGIAPDHKAALLRTDLLNAKAVGLNMVRFIASRATPEQLDACDELGLMVYEECNASWPHGYAPGLEARFDTEMRETVHRDRNHPCVVAWGLLNETRDGPMFRHAVASLPLVRELDPTRLVLLASGRWDGDPSIGSVCRPHRHEWEHLWGAESPGAEPVADPVVSNLGYVSAVGDRHLYPSVPHSTDDLALLGTMGDGERPIFLSEYGIGSLFDAVRESRELQLGGANPQLAEPTLIADMLRRYLADYDRFGLADVFAFPEDLFEASYVAHSAHRLEGLNRMRGNPQLVGHNVTGMLDHAVTGEGLWTFASRELKPGVVDALRDGLAPLRWCIGLDPVHSTVGTPVQVEISLADEAVLAPGPYEGAVRILGPDGPVWEHTLRVTVPDTGTPRLVHPVSSTGLRADLPAGDYRVTASLDSAAAPRGRTAQMWRTDPIGSLEDLGTVTIAGSDDRLSSWLTGHGVAVEHRLSDVATGGTIVVPAAPELSEAAWVELWEAVRNGATAVLPEADATLDCDLWRKHAPLPIRVERTREWLYHTETIGLRHRLFAGLPGPGILDWSFFGQTMPLARLRSAVDPTAIGAVAIGVGLPQPGGYASGFVAAEWRLATGRILAGTLRLVEHLDIEPAAGLLLANLLRCARTADTAGRLTAGSARQGE